MYQPITVCTPILFLPLSSFHLTLSIVQDTPGAYFHFSYKGARTNIDASKAHFSPLLFILTHLLPFDVLTTIYAPMGLVLLAKGTPFAHQGTRSTACALKGACAQRPLIGLQCKLHDSTSSMCMIFFHGNTPYS